jgi:hypothetical protein
MGVHESQSLLWERMVALGLPFARYVLARIQKAFPDAKQFAGRTPEELHAALNVVKDPSLIRVEADEVRVGAGGVVWGAGGGGEGWGWGREGRSVFFASAFCLLFKHTLPGH